MDNSIIIREAVPGEPSLAVNFYYKLFEEQFDFLPATEKYFLHAAEEYFDDEINNKLWLATENGKIVGSVCVVKKEKNKAQIRLFGTAPSTQGKGVGKALLKTAMDYCSQNNLTHIMLWTIDICKAALHLYKNAGFRKTEEKLNTTWAKYRMTEEKWEFFSTEQ